MMSLLIVLRACLSKMLLLLCASDWPVCPFHGLRCVCVCVCLIAAVALLPHHVAIILMIMFIRYLYGMFWTPLVLLIRCFIS